MAVPRGDVLQMITRLAKTLGLSVAIGNHTLSTSRGTPPPRNNGNSLDEAQEIANHASPRAAALDSYRRDPITLDAVERIGSQ